MSQYKNNQAGFVSLFSVIFFMLLVSVLTVGFLRLMILEQQQSLDNDLSDSAKASAQSGIEDGKRAILKYQSLAAIDPLKAQFNTALNSTACDSVLGNAAVTGSLGISSNGNVVGNSQINQFYTCLNVQLNTPDYLGPSPLPAGSSDFVPLRPSSGTFDQIKVSWHLLSTAVGEDGDGQPRALAPGPALMPLNNPLAPPNSWSQLGYPAYLRVQLYGYPNVGVIDRAGLTQRSRAVVLVPAAAGPGVVSLGAADATPGVFDSLKVAPTQIACNPSFTSYGSYDCTATLSLPAGLPSSGNVYFLRVTPVYGQTHFRLQMFNSVTGLVVNFNEVQPIIDATGRAADVYRRMQARVRVNATGNLPEFVVESADNICKNEEVSSDPLFYKANVCL